MLLLRAFTGCCLAAWLAVQPVMADIDPAEYQLKSSVRSQKERQRLEAQFEADRQSEAAVRQLEEDEAARRLAADQAAVQALPYPVRLTTMRCNVCHGAANYASERHNRIGWELVVLRMQHLNAALVATGERSVIAAHLAETYPAAGKAALIEAMQQFAAALTPGLLWVAWKSTRARAGKGLRKFSLRNKEID